MLPGMQPAARFVIVVVVLLMAGGVARAQSGGAAGKAKAVELLGSGDKKLARGQKLYDKGDIEKALEEYESALVDYQAAYEAFPDPKIYYPIAQAEQRLGRFVDALQHYQQLLEEGKDVAGQLRNQVERELIDVKKNLAAVLIEAQPEGALVLIDGSQVARTPMQQPVFVEPGAHTLTVKLEGFKTVEKKVDLAMGKEFRERFTLKAGDGEGGGGGEAGGGAARPGGGAGGAGVEVDRGTDRPSKALLVVGITVSSALFVAGTVTGFMALSKHGTFHDDGADDDDREQARRDGKQLAGLTDVFLGAALVGGLVTTYYYFGVYKPGMQAAADADDAGDGSEEADDEEEEETAWQIAPLVGGDFAGVAASGRF
jgi:hypothetical protein